MLTEAICNLGENNIVLLYLINHIPLCVHVTSWIQNSKSGFNSIGGSNPFAKLGNR